MKDFIDFHQGLYSVEPGRLHGNNYYLVDLLCRAYEADWRDLTSRTIAIDSINFDAIFQRYNETLCSKVVYIKLTCACIKTYNFCSYLSIHL